MAKDLSTQARGQDDVSQELGGGGFGGPDTGGWSDRSPDQTPPGGDPQPVSGYEEGPPQRPEIKWDEDFQHGVRDPGLDDWKARAEWEAKRHGARLLRPDLDDALDMYDHYWDNNGEPVEFDYSEAEKEDPHVAKNIADEVARATSAVDAMAAEKGDGSFQISGPATATTHYPETENWQKAMGGYQQWSSADVTVKDGMVTMEVTVHAEDKYNFNRDQSDIATGTPDEANGRFQEVGWAKSFESHGQVTKTVTWPVGHPDQVTVTSTSEPTGR